MNGETVQCTVCRHEIVKVGDHWECEQQCRCLMVGCVPALAKYGTNVAESVNDDAAS